MKDSFALAVSAAVDTHKKLIAESGLRVAEDVSFQTCGCEVAWPSWYMQPNGRNKKVDCVHLGCQIRRGEYRRPAWALFMTAKFRAELQSGWLRFCKETPTGRVRAARLYWACKKDQKFSVIAAVHTGISV